MPRKGQQQLPVPDDSRVKKQRKVYTPRDKSLMKSEIIPLANARVTAPPEDKERKLNEQMKHQIIGSLQMGADMSIAAKLVGISRAELFRTLKRDPEFAELVKEARSFADDNVIRSLYTAAIGGNITAMIFWLKNRKPDEWRDNHELTLKGAELVSSQLNINVNAAPEVRMIDVVAEPCPTS